MNLHIVHQLEIDIREEDWYIIKLLILREVALLKIAVGKFTICQVKHDLQQEVELEKRRREKGNMSNL